MLSMTIGELARQARVSVGTVRFYERRGLIAAPPRRASGYRAYPAETVRRLRFIRRAKKLGFSLREIQELLALRSEPTGACEEVQEQAAAKLQDIHERIQDLSRMANALKELHALCGSANSMGGCPLLDLLEGAGDA